jgi:hypothetical protein
MEGRRVVWFGRRVLGLISGYSDTLSSILATSVIVVGVSAVLFGFVTHVSPAPLNPPEAILTRFSAVHGRTTFEPLGAWSPAAWVAAVDSVMGVVIEGVFVAMLIQRFFGR